MPRSKLPRNVTPGPSNDPEDKLHACMSYGVGRGSKRDADYLKAPLYYDACWDWYESLSEDWQDFVTYVLDAFTNWGDDYAKRWTAKPPPAPRCPL
jgi:hypothetical protein